MIVYGSGGPCAVADITQGDVDREPVDFKQARLGGPDMWRVLAPDIAQHRLHVLAGAEVVRLVVEARAAVDVVLRVRVADQHVVLTVVLPRDAVQAEELALWVASLGG